MFGRIGGVLEDSTDRIFVADYQAGEVRVFAPEGGHLFTFGGKGAGPGELSGPCCLAWAPDGSLWIRDGENRRYSSFQIGDSSAAFVTTRDMAHTDVNYWAPVTFTSAGELIDVGHRASPQGARELVSSFDSQSIRRAGSRRPLHWRSRNLQRWEDTP